jgi:hypothetical protein
MLYTKPPQEENQIESFVREVCAAAMYASRIATHHSLSANTPSAIAFQRPTLTNVPIVTDWATIAANRQYIINKAVAAQNRK